MPISQYESILKGLPLYRNKRITITPVEGGMTNHNFHILYEDVHHIAKFAQNASSALGLSRHREIYNYKEVEKIDIGAKVIAHYPKYNLLIVEYIQGEILNREMASNPEILSLVVKMLKKLHTTAKLKGSFDVVVRTRRYIKATEEAGGWLPKNISQLKKNFEKAVEKVQPLYQDDSCHLDLMLENILITPKGNAKLIDWEYSSMADYRYDLAMLSVKSGFTSEEDELLAKLYDPKKSKHFLSTLDAMKMIIYFAEASYGLLQNTISKKNVDYKTYAQENIKEFEKLALRLLSK